MNAVHFILRQHLGGCPYERISAANICQITFKSRSKHGVSPPRYAFVSQPQTKGVAERFLKTLKQEAIYGRIFNNADGVRQAVANFVDDYNHHWQSEKLDYLSPV